MPPDRAPAAAVQTLPVAAASPSAKEAPEQRVARLQHEVSQLRQRFLAAAERDPQVVKGSTAQGHLTAAVSPALFEDVVRRVAAHYLDRVDVQLDGVKVEKTGEIHKDTFLGKIHAGDWTAFIWFPQIRGTLRAGVPRVRLPGGNRVLVEMPVHLERGSGTARVHFTWDSRGGREPLLRRLRGHAGGQRHRRAPGLPGDGPVHHGRRPRRPAGAAVVRRPLPHPPRAERGVLGGDPRRRSKRRTRSSAAGWGSTRTTWWRSSTPA